MRVYLCGFLHFHIASSSISAIVCTTISSYSHRSASCRSFVIIRHSVRDNSGVMSKAHLTALCHYHFHSFSIYRIFPFFFLVANVSRAPTQLCSVRYRKRKRWKEIESEKLASAMRLQCTEQTGVCVRLFCAHCAKALNAGSLKSHRVIAIMTPSLCHINTKQTDFQ